jgi:tetratricopeptide (TPR) repeat protein
VAAEKAAGRLDRAEALLREALERAERRSDDPTVAAILGELAHLIAHHGRYGEAEQLAQRALDLLVDQYGEVHPYVASALARLAFLHQRQGNEERALPLLQSALEIDERVLGAGHPNVAARLVALAGAYESEGRHGDAEPLLRRSLAILEAAYGVDHPETAGALGRLGASLLEQDRADEAEAFALRALAIRERLYGREEPALVGDLARVGSVYLSRKDYAAAEPYYGRAARLDALQDTSVQSAVQIHQLAAAQRASGHAEDADALYKWGLDFFEHVAGRWGPNTAFLRERYLEHLRVTGRYAEATALEQSQSALE